MSSHERDYQTVFSYLRALDFHFLDTWVKECVNFYKKNNPNISLDVLKNEVKQQWLLVNLRDIKVPSLPPNLRTKDKIIVDGKYAVQVESMIDSSVSCYSQYQKMKKVFTDDADENKETKEWNVKSNRCLTLVLCDGVQEIEAMEYEPIRKIRLNDPELLPGFKMIIIGPVECRKGMMLLKEQNVKICGGEVDTLANSHSLKSLLIRKLELNDNDFIDNISIDDTTINTELYCGNSLENAQALVTDEAKDSITCDYENVENLLSQNDDLFLALDIENKCFEQKDHSLKDTLKSFEKCNSGNENKPGVSPSLVKFDTDVLNHENLFGYSFSSVKKKHNLSQEDLYESKKKRINFHSSVDDDLFIDNSNSTTQNLLNNMNEEIFIDEPFENKSMKTKSAVQTKLSNFFRNSNELKDSKHNIPSQALVQNQKSNNSLFSHKPFVYLKQIVSTTLKQPFCFVIKGVILTINTKITLKNEKFNLRATITDSSLTIDVDFSSDILEDILGFSPCEMSVMLKEKQTNSAIAGRVKHAFEKARMKLISLNCLMEIKFYTDGKCPLIVNLKEIIIQDLNALKDRKV